MPNFKNIKIPVIFRISYFGLPFISFQHNDSLIDPDLNIFEVHKLCCSYFKSYQKIKGHLFMF